MTTPYEQKKAEILKEFELLKGIGAEGKDGKKKILLDTATIIPFLSQALDEIAREVREAGRLEKVNERNMAKVSDDWSLDTVKEVEGWNAAITQSERQLSTYGVPRE